jgi:hypothetical protein
MKLTGRRSFKDFSRKTSPGSTGKVERSEAAKSAWGEDIGNFEHFTLRLKSRLETSQVTAIGMT